MQCPTCKRELDAGVRFCPNDGTPLTETGATRANSTPTGGKQPQSKPLILPVTIGGRYRLEELRGGGGMAKVYRAVDLTLEREVAVKLINPELRNDSEFDARFQREARIASQLADPHIVVVHDFGFDPEHGPFLVMEYLQGQSLREQLATGGPMPLKAGLQLAGQIVLALIHAHSKGIVHRDIKPDNVFLLNQSGVRLHVRVLDFGIARIYRGDDSNKSETITHAGAVLGTPRYMSPEQLAGQPVDARSDLYSTALLIYEALTGQLPYLHGKKLSELCPEATPGLEELLADCLNPNPDDRPKNAVEMYLRLQDLGKASGVLLLPPGSMNKLIEARRASQEPTVLYVPKEEGKSRLKSRLLVGVVVLIAVLGLVALVKGFWPTPTGYVGGPERLHNLRVGSEATGPNLLGRSTLLRSIRGNPWERPQTRALMHPALRSEDLGLPAEKLPNLETFYSDDDKLVVLAENEVILAILSTSPDAKSTGGVGLGASVREIERKYKGHEFFIGSASHGGQSVELYRFPKLGITFEVRSGSVVAIALYPPRD